MHICQTGRNKYIAQTERDKNYDKMKVSDKLSHIFFLHFSIFFLTASLAVTVITVMHIILLNFDFDFFIKLF